MVSRKLRFAIFGNTYQPKKSVSVQKLLACLTQRQADVCIEREFYEFLTAGQRLPIDNVLVIEDRDFKADFVISMGGDGTFLRAASMVGGKQIPILGINTGRLGFLADVQTKNVDMIMDQLIKGKYTIEQRTLLHVETSRSDLIMAPYALNEVAVMKYGLSSMITIETRVNDELLHKYEADGLLFSTPTGSTAYNLSIGGPLMVPQARGIILSPIATHSLNVRPLVVPDDWEIDLTVRSRTGSYLISVDGRSQVMSHDITLHIKKADYTIKLVQVGGNSFLQSLKDKLLWGQAN